jgi:hypothetical protein
LQEVLEIASVFPDTQLSSTWKRNSQVFENVGRILYFTYKLPISMPFGIKLTSMITPRQEKNAPGTPVSFFQNVTAAADIFYWL